eukprot:COSAG02_NODE_13_length_57813_cov_14.298276_44_plen_190_part_00
MVRCTDIQYWIQIRNFSDQIPTHSSQAGIPLVPRALRSQKLLGFCLEHPKSSQTCILAEELLGRLRYSTQELSGHESSSGVTNASDSADRPKTLVFFIPVSTDIRVWFCRESAPACGLNPDPACGQRRTRRRCCCCSCRGALLGGQPLLYAWLAAGCCLAVWLFVGWLAGWLLAGHSMCREDRAAAVTQ